MSNNEDSSPDSTNSTAFGIWKDNQSLILNHKGVTFHKLVFGRSSNNLCLNLEETVFALLRTNFILVDYHNKKLITAEYILKELQNSKDIKNLLKIHVYLAFHKLGKCPKPIVDVFTSSTEINLTHFNLENLLDKERYKDKYTNKTNDNVELHLLLDHFKRNFTLNIVDYKAYLSSPVYLVDGLEVFVTMPDSLVYNLLDNISDFNKIIAVSNLDTVYFLTVPDPVTL